MLNTNKVPEEDLTRLRLILEDASHGLLNASDSFPLIFDTGCTKSATGFISDFEPGILCNLDTSLEMYGIAGGLIIRKVGTVKYDVQLETITSKPLRLMHTICLICVTA